MEAVMTGTYPRIADLTTHELERAVQLVARVHRAGNRGSAAFELSGPHGRILGRVVVDHPGDLVARAESVLATTPLVLDGPLRFDPCIQAFSAPVAVRRTQHARTHVGVR
jgi:hypothetical protein